MASTNLALKIKGVDQTGGVFKSIAAKAKGLGGSFKSLMAVAGLGGALAAVGMTIKRLGELSDIAANAGTTTDALTGMSKAFDVLGVKGGTVEELGKSFAIMTKNTGRTGAEGFKQTIEELGKLPTVQERAKAAMEAFGKSGLNYLPLIEDAARNGSSDLLRMAELMPHVSQAAADAGDDAADAMSIAAGTVKQVWMETIGAVCKWFSENFDGGIRVAVWKAGEYTKAFFRNFASGMLNWYKLQIKTILNLVKLGIDAVKAVFTSATMEDAWAKFKENMSTTWAEAEFVRPEDRERIEKQARELAEIYRRHGRVGRMDELDALGETAKSAARASNKWMGAGSYEAATMGLRAQFAKDDAQTREAKKANDWLRKIFEKKNNADLSVVNFDGANY